MIDKKQIVESLLNDITNTIKSYKEQWQKTGEKYNIFSVADIAHNEVIMCRVLADLLNPKGRHCQGSRFLALFWESITSQLPDDLSLTIENTKVVTEYVIDENRRIDITLEDGNVFIPIEVKIFAGDQPKQIFDYFEFAKKKNKSLHVPVLYLTLDGHEPSNFSKDMLEENDYVLLSFKDDILSWLEACIHEKAIETIIPVHENLKQLIAAIKSLCGKSEDEEMETDIFNFVTKDDDSARAALAISSVVDFGNRAWEIFKGPLLERVQKVFPDTECLVESGWYYLNIPIKDGKYLLEINYLWDQVCVQAVNPEDAASAEATMIYEKMSDLFNVHPSVLDGFAWFCGNTAWPDFPKDDLYQFHLCKLYMEKTQDVAEKIINIAKVLNDIKV
jgi:hypothetical protein